MASTRAFADSVIARLDQRDMRVHPMFGEFAVYCDDRVVGLITDDTLWIKITDAGRAYAGRIATGSPYPGAKEYFRISRARLADAAWLEGMVDVTAAAVPLPRPRRPRAPRARRER